MSKKQQRNNWSFLLIMAGMAILVYSVVRTPRQAETHTYSDIMGMFNRQEVTTFTLDYGTGELELNVQGRVDSISFQVPNVELFMRDVEGAIAAYNEAHPNAHMVYELKPPVMVPWWLANLPYILLLVGMIALWYFMINQAGGGGKAMNVGKAKVKTPAEETQKTTFADVAGADEEKEELRELVEFLKSPKRFNALGARIPKGVLLVGPPGTGKTLLAKSVSGEAGVPFYAISGSDFVEMYVGVGASRVRDLFDRARKTAPCIIFIDEIDAVGRQRGAGLGGGHDEREQTLNQLLVEMDGFSGHEGVIVIAATNRSDILDKALLRPGRFDRQIYVGYPDVKGREEILRIHTRNKPLGPDVDLSIIAKSTIGFTGADLENLANEAALLAARENRKALTERDFEDATMKVIAGPEKKSRVVTQEERNLTAYHEGGHAIATYFVETAHPVHEISIIPRGMAGGYTLSLPENDRRFVTKKEMEGEIITLLGGRVAEQLILGDISTGASNDLERATGIARSMVKRYGFSDRLGAVVYGQGDHETFLGRDISQGQNYSEAVAAEIDAEIRRLIDDSYVQTEKILTENIDKLHLLAQMLLTNEKISGQEFKQLMEGPEETQEAEVIETVVMEENIMPLAEVVQEQAVVTPEGNTPLEDTEK